MSQNRLPDPHAALRNCEHLLQFDRFNAQGLCEVGLALRRLNRPAESRKCYKAAVNALHHAVRIGNVEAALSFELLIYNSFVSTIEQEEHYYRCFADWKDELAALGRRFRDPSALSGADAGRIAFFLQTGRLLGHTEVLLKLLELRPRMDRQDAEPCIYVLGDFDVSFVERCQSLGVEVVLVQEEMPGRAAPWEAAFAWLRQRFRRDGVGVCIWVSAPTMVAFAFSMRIAPVQVFWALRFHPVTGPYIDGYISYGAAHEMERKYGKQSWRVCPPPLTIDVRAPDRSAVEKARAAFPEPVLLGTIAREQKVNSAPYLECVARVLKANPHAGYLWTGKIEHPEVAAFFRSNGLADRCHFAGWVDVNLFANVLDVFLETFPLGGGISGHCALAYGIPVVSRLGPYTIFGNHLWHAHASGSRAAIDPASPLASEHILCTRDDNEYVGRANRLVADPSYRQAVGRAGRAFFDGEAASGRDYARRFFGTVREIAAGKAAGAARSSSGGIVT